MRVLVLFLALATVLTLPSSAQWIGTGMTTQVLDAVGDVEVHGGTLFAATSGRGFVRSDDGGTTWQTAGQTGFETNPISVSVTAIQSAGTDLYVVTFNANHASSMLYRSSDGGRSFVPDTSGLPTGPANGQLVNIDRLYDLGGTLAVDVANVGNWLKRPGSARWARNADAGTQYAEHFGTYAGRLHTWGEYHSYVSTDQGVTWTQGADSGVPPFFVTSLLTIDPSNGRVWVAGRSITTNAYRLLYSDDQGARWDSLAIDGYRGRNWLGLRQTVQALFVRGDYIQLALDNDAANTPPDLLVSVDGGASFAVDSAGLPSGFQTVIARAFVEFQGDLYMALNFGDVYRKATSFGTAVEPAELRTESLVVWPNPSDGPISLRAGTGAVEVFDVVGRLVVRVDVREGADTSIDLPRRGVFFLRSVETTGRSRTAKVVVR